MTSSDSEISIDFNPDLFNNLYWHLEESFDNLSVRYIWLYGGSSASKTYSVVQLIIKKMLEGSQENTLILRKFHVDIKDSIYADFKNIISTWELNEYFIIQQDFIKCITGSYVRFRGLDDSEKVKGITGFKRVIMEEVSQFDEVDFKQVRKRLRGQAGQQIIGIFNPISEDHWIKINIFDKEKLAEEKTNICGKWLNASDNTVIMKTNYLDNKFIVGPAFIDVHVIADFEKDKESDFAYYRIYGLGDWGKLRTGGEFWKDFNQNLHVKKSDWNEDLALHISWDKNVNPYLPVSIWQIDLQEGKRKKATQIDEIAMEDPRNRVRYVAMEFKKRYPVEKVIKLYIYGDRTAIQEDVLKEKGENMYTDIMDQFREYKPVLRMQSVNPSVIKSASFVNECYRGTQPIDIEVDPRCKKSIYDYTYALEDANGDKAMINKKHPVTQVTYQEFHHFSDTKRYFFTVAFASEYQTYLRGNKALHISQGKAVAKHGY